MLVVLLTQNSMRCLRSDQSSVIIFVFFAHKKYFRSFEKLRLNPWCHMDYFNISLLCFWALIVVVPLVSMKGQKALRFLQKYLNVCSEDERRSYRFGTTWGWVINDRIVIFGWTIPLSLSSGQVEWKSVRFDVFSLNSSFMSLYRCQKDPKHKE